ncbi:hypothetical protein [Proteus faecis]|uniref:hypothetical protein n=1 Tax=Proteus faecis TaxID=2050967 RepID=UPI003075D077
MKNTLSSNPERIYKQIQFIINDLISRLNENTSDSETQAAAVQSLELLNNLHQQILEKLSLLEKNAEWDTFTVALYGETNAGKSTIIETLRILLKEKTKINEQEEFDSALKNLGITTESIKRIRNDILDSDNKLSKLNQTWLDKKNNLETNIKVKKDIVDLSYQELLSSLKKLNILQKILSLFISTKEKKQYQQSKVDLATSETHLLNEEKIYTTSVKELHQHIYSLEEQNKKIEYKLQTIAHLADGQIIGNGRSDYTLQTHSYQFIVDNCKFNFLDVPGIEGKESKVETAIWEAVQKAHAIFYITSKASAPQKGDGKNMGTLGKIKQHLGDQSEVWTIFNKRIQNPIQLEKDSLLSDGEKESLIDLDNKMAECLGDSYQKSIALSAYPAFLSISTCLLPGSRDAVSREKFLAKYNSDVILHKSDMHKLTSMFNSSMIDDFKQKIIIANHNKAKKVVDHALLQVIKLHENKFHPLSNALRAEISDKNVELRSLITTLKSRLKNQTREQIRNFSSNVRKETYKRIDDDISNDDFKNVLRSCVERNQKSLVNKLPDVVKEETTLFEQRLKDVITRFEQQTSGIVSDFNMINSVDSDLNFKMDNGISVWGIVGSLGGGALLFFTPMGWALVAVSAATLVFQAYKAIRSFFSSNYKQSQQRKSVDDNLYKLEDEIESKIDEKIDEIIASVNSHITDVSQAMQSRLIFVENIDRKLIMASHELSAIKNKLEF